MKTILAMLIMLVSLTSNASERLVCSGGNPYWGGGIFEITLRLGICYYTKYNGNRGLKEVTRNSYRVETGDSSKYADYAAPLTCDGYKAQLKTDAQGKYIVVGYPGVAHGNIPSSVEKIRCKIDPKLPNSLEGLMWTDVTKEVSKQ